MDRDQFFGDLFSEDNTAAEAIREQRQLAYEERVIKRIFSECGIKIAGWGRFVNECRDVTGKDRLNFGWFNRSFRRFPSLCARRIPRLHELTMADLFKPAARNRLVKAVIKTLQRIDVDTERQFVFVFPVTRTAFCAHNIELESTAIDRVVWRASNSTGATLFVEPLPMFCQQFGNQWFDPM